jgi:O-antigen ligase
MHRPLIRFVPESGSQVSPIIRWCLYLFLFSLPFETLGSSREESAFVSISRLIGYVFTLTTFLQVRICYRRPPAAFWGFTLFLAVCTVLALPVEGYAAERASAFLLTLTQTIILFWVCYNLFQDERVRGAFPWFYIAAVLLLAILQLSGFLETQAVEGEETRATVLSLNANAYGLCLGVALTSLICMLYGRASRIFLPLPLLLLSAIPLLISLLGTGSRSAMAGLLIGIAALILNLSGSWKQRLSRLSVAAGTILAVVFLATQSETLMERWEKALEKGNYSQREFIYPVSWAMIQESPWIGWRPGEDSVELRNRLLATANRNTALLRTKERSAHNLALAALMRAGLLGGIPYLLAWVFCGIAAWNARKGTEGIMPFALFLVLLISALATSTMYRKVVWVYLAYAAAAGAVVAQQRRAKQQILPMPPPWATLEAGEPNDAR